MEELKTCLFCGKYVDKTFPYCPYCGYEFSQGDEEAGFAEDCEEEPRGSEEAPADARAETPDPIEPVLRYLSRLRDIETQLAEMEKELDLIISATHEPEPALREPGVRPGRDPIRWPGLGPVTSSSKGP